MRMSRADAGRGVLADFEAGLRLLFEGGRFLRRAPSLWPLAIVPVFLALVAVAIAGSLFLANLAAIVAWCDSLLPVFEATNVWSWLWVGPATFVVWVAGGLIVVVLFAVAIVAALLAANLASAPFLERLSARVERLAQAGGADAPAGEPSAPTAVLRSFAAEVQRIGCLVLAWVGLSLVALIVPGATFVTTPLLVALTVLFLPLEYAGHALDRRGLSFRDRIRFVRANWATMAGFGTVAFVACFVPGFNLLVMPALVTAGTLLVVRREPVAEDAPASDLASF
jgi:CysZ protein